MLRFPIKLPRYTPLQLIIHLTAFILAAWLALDFYNGKLTVNPIQVLEQRTGRYAIYFLVLSLACTPINTVFGFRQALTVRRSLGLYAFLFAASHFLLFIGLDYGFQLGLVLVDVGTKRYILVGALALATMIPLAITSFKWWMKRMGKNWKRLHKLVYLTGVAAVLHFAWARKGDLFSLQGDVRAPLLLGLSVLILLILRISPIRRYVANSRRRITDEFIPKLRFARLRSTGPSHRKEEHRQRGQVDKRQDILRG